MSVHESLKNLKKWAEIDINNSPIRKNIVDLINTDLNQDSPTIIKNIDGKYSPFRKHFSDLGKTQLDMLKSEKKLRSTAYVLLATVKFKKLLKNKAAKTNI